VALDGQYRSFNRQQAHFRRDPAKPRKTAEFTSRCQDSMARHNERDRIATKRLANGPGSARLTQLDCNVAIGRRATGADSARRRIHALMKCRHPMQVDRNAGEITSPAGEQRRDIVDRSLHDVSGHGFPHVAKSPP
jgi:hypothetical protein